MRLASEILKILSVWNQRLPTPPVEYRSSSLILTFQVPSSSSLNMVRFITVFASTLSLLSFTHAVAIDTRECDKYKCPAILRDGTGKLDQQLDIYDTLQCLYDTGSAKGQLYGCLYSSVCHISLSNFQL